MKNYKIIYILIIITCLSISSYSQYNTDPIFGLNPVLYNGKFYSFNLSDKTGGHPCIYTPEFESGCVIIKNIKYNDILLNYDIYNQELLLKYKDLLGSEKVIKLSKAWLNGFSLHDNEFLFLNGSDGQKRFFQVIGHDTLKVLYHWHKKLLLSMQTGNTSYQFSKPEKTMYLFRNEIFYQFRNNKSFIAFFETDKKVLIKKYIQQNRINVRKAPDAVMQNLITYCDHLNN